MSDRFAYKIAHIVFAHREEDREYIINKDGMDKILCKNEVPKIIERISAWDMAEWREKCVTKF